MLLLIAAAAAIQGSFTPLNHRPLPPSKDDFTFVALGDDRPAGAGLPPTATFREILKEVSLIDPAFVICGGDLLYGNDDTLAQYRQEIAWMKPLLETVPCPFFNVPGNHEVDNKPEFLSAYNSELGPSYGEFDYGQFRFLAVCTDLPGDKTGVYGPQMDWLKGVLADPKPTITFQHHPVFARPTNTDPPEDTTAADAAELHQLYQKGGVRLAFEAHDHVFNEQHRDGIDYIISGDAGAPLDALPTDGGYFGYTIVQVHGDTYKATPVAMDALEAVPISDGVVAVAEYADTDIPVGNLVVHSTRKPKGVVASWQKKGKEKAVDAHIVLVRRVASGYDTQVSLVAPKHHATFVRLTY